MPRSKSVLKRQRQNEARRQRNKAVRSELRTFVKRARTAATSGGDAAEELKQAQKRIDRAAASGVIHKNKAARQKSRLAKAAARAKA